MKISIKDLAGGGYTTLTDASHTDGMLQWFEPHHSVMMQADDLPGSVAKFRKPRGNISCSITLTFDTPYSSASDALASVRTIYGWLNKSVALKVEEGVAAEVQYYGNGVVTGCSSKPMGKSALHTMTFETDAVTTSDPT